MSNFYTDDLLLPEVSFSDCMPEINESEIASIYVARKNASRLTDWTNSDEWLMRFLLQGNSSNSIRKLSVVGSIDSPALTTLKISGGRTKDTYIIRTVNVSIDDSTRENYDFSRFTEYEINVRLWYETKAKKLFGGNTGIIGKLKIFPVYASGTGSLETYTGTFVWNAQLSPDRINNPFAEIDIQTGNIQFLLTDGRGNYITDGQGNFIKIQN